MAESTDATTARQALIALAHVSHSDVRALALRRTSVALLTKNHQPGDHALILRWLAEADGEDAIHDIAQDSLEFWKAHPDPPTAPDLLIQIYERNPCQQCRETAVRDMLELGCLPDRIAEECLFDASEEIRSDRKSVV